MSSPAATTPGSSRSTCQAVVRAVLAGCLVFGSLSDGRAQSPTDTKRVLQRTQTLALKKGWNAVYLEVEPLVSDPNRLLDGLPIDVVATYFPSTGSIQFATDPGVDLFRNLGWGVWYAKTRKDAILTTLDSLYGRRAYLVHAREDHTWNVRGAVLPGEVIWQPDAFNFVGFPVAAVGAPSFAEFFAGSNAHRHGKIYRLVDGAWRKVNDPAAEAMRSGEAFWIYCDGASRYRGPLCVETKMRRGLMLVDGGTDKLILRNETDHPIAATIEHLTPLAEAVPLSVVVRVVGDPTSPIRSVSAEKPAGAWTQGLPTIEAGRSIALPFEARLGEMVRATHGSLLKITSDLGTECWVPVLGYRSDLESKE